MRLFCWLDFHMMSFNWLLVLILALIVTTISRLERETPNSRMRMSLELWQINWWHKTTIKVIGSWYRCWSWKLSLLGRLFGICHLKYFYDIVWKHSERIKGINFIIPWIKHKRRNVCCKFGMQMLSRSDTNIAGCLQRN